MYTNMDHSRSWKGNTLKNPPEWSGVAVYVHGMSNHASVEQYVALFNSITGGLIFVRPNRNEDGSLQGTMVVQYKTRDQADKLLAGLVSDAKHRVEGKIVLSDRSCYEYLVEMKDVTDNAQYYLLDPLGGNATCIETKEKRRTPGLLEDGLPTATMRTTTTDKRGTYAGDNSPTNHWNGFTTRMCS